MTNPKFMNVEDAAEIIMELANRAAQRQDHLDDMEIEPDYKVALDTMQDFFVNNVWND